MVTATDRSTELAIHSIFGSTSFNVFETISFIGSSTIEVPLLLLIVAGLIFAQRFRGAALFVATVIGGRLLSTLVKVLVARPRPHLFANALHTGGYSFPSGHATNALAFFGALAYLSWQLPVHRVVALITTAIAILIISLIGLSRIVLGVHYPSDVIGGYALGCVWLITTVLLFTSTTRHHDRSNHPAG
jgi:undecaprenyl-diphosphatase